MALSRRQRATAEERASKGYPGVMHARASVVQVQRSDWMSQFEAAEALKVSVLRVGNLIANRHLVPAENERGEAGVTRDSVDREWAWRSTASRVRRAVRLLRDLVNWL